MLKFMVYGFSLVLLLVLLLLMVSFGCECM